MIWSVMRLTTVGSTSRAMSVSIMSVAAMPPAQVKRLPSISNRRFVSSISRNSSEKAAWFSQWIVHRLSSSRPALARMSAPVHSAPMGEPRRDCLRSQVSTGFVAALWAFSPETTTIRASRGTSPSPPATSTRASHEDRTGAPVSEMSRQS